MKAYGHTRTDKQECKYGCCTTKSGKMKNCRPVVDRAKRKSARQEQEKDCIKISDEKYEKMEFDYE